MAVGDTAAGDAEGGGAGQGEGGDLEGAAGKATAVAVALEGVAPGIARGQGEEVREVEEAVIRLDRLGHDVRRLEKLRLELAPEGELVGPGGVVVVGGVEGQGVADDEERGVGLAVGVARRPPAPDRKPACPGQGHEVVGVAGLAVAVGRRIGLTPAVVMLAGGEEKLPAAGMRPEAVRRPQGEELGSEMGMVVLGDETQLAVKPVDDHRIPRAVPT